MPRSTASVLRDWLAATPTVREDIAYWGYTSGSTGRPKAAVHSHKDFLAAADLVGVGIFGLRPDDLVFSASKMYFAFGLGNALYFPARVGAHLGGIAGRRLGQPPTHDAHGRIALHRPAQTVDAMVHGADDDIVCGVLDELIEGGVQGAGQGDELVQRQAALAVLDAAQRGLAEVGAGGQFLQGQALCDP